MLDRPVRFLADRTNSEDALKREFPNCRSVHPMHKLLSTIRSADT